MNMALYLVGINLLTFFCYWLDKRAAIAGRRRVPESSLLAMGFAGGTFAAFFAQRRLRHKNRKASFQFKFWALTLVQIGALVFFRDLLPL